MLKNLVVVVFLDQDAKMWLFCLSPCILQTRILHSARSRLSSAMEFFLRSLLPDDRDVAIVVDRAASSSSSSLSRRSSCCSIASQTTCRWGGDDTCPIDPTRDAQGFIGFEKFVTMQSLPRIPRRRNSNEEAVSTNIYPRNEVLDHSLGPLPRRRPSVESIDESELAMVRKSLIAQMNLSSGSLDCEGLFNERSGDCLLMSPIQDRGSLETTQLNRHCSPKSRSNSKSSLLRNKIMDRRSESSSDSLTQVINLVDLMAITSR